MGRLHFAPNTKALLGTKPGSIKRLNLIAAEMKSVLAEMKAGKTKGLKEIEKKRLNRRAWYLMSDLRDYQIIPKTVFLSKVPRSTVRMYHTLPRMMFVFSE